MFTGQAEAYRPETTQVTAFANNTYLITHTFTSGFLNEASTIPLLASIAEPKTEDNTITYFSLTAPVALNASATTALILSDAPIMNNQYVIPAATRATFTLLTIVTLPTAVDPKILGITINSLPLNYKNNKTIFYQSK